MSATVGTHARRRQPAALPAPASFTAATGAYLTPHDLGIVLGALHIAADADPGNGPAYIGVAIRLGDDR